MSRILRLQTLNATSSSSSTPDGEDSTISAGLCSSLSAGLCPVQN
jgi:hypothetical protein